MIPPASVQRKWGFLTTILLVPLALTSVRVQPTEARQSSSSPLADGAYLYGDSSQPNQMHHRYVVFQHQNGKVVGAFYTPRSEFECFSGDLHNKTLKAQTIRSENAQSIAVKTKLADLQPIATVSQNDQRILSVCKQAAVSLASQRVN